MTEENKRRLVTARTIDAVEPIEGADAIEVVVIGGWKVVVKKGEFKPNDPCIYFEIDSFLPDGNPAWQFLVDKSPKMFEGVKGHKLRTIKLRGQVSQGFVLPIGALPAVAYVLADDAAPRDLDFSALLGIKKFEAPLPACLQGQAEGLFPSFIQKTDQERCQNLKGEIFGYDEVRVALGDWLDVKVTPPSHNQLIQGMSETGTWEEVWNEAEPLGTMTHWKPIMVRPAKASRDDQFEVSIKLDGSSMTAFVRADETGTDDSRVLEIAPRVGVCSRNLELKISDANKDNTFVRVLFDTCLNVALEAWFQRTGIEIAVQGEVMGPGIQGNREGFTKPTLFVFDVFFINDHRYATPAERMAVFDFLKSIAPTIEHVPVLHSSATLEELGTTTVELLLAFAEGPSINNKIREGVVFKRKDGQFSFKAISNLFLAKEKD